MAAKFTEEQLNSADRSLLIQMILNLQDQSEELTMEEHDLSFLEDLLPWSPSLPEHIRKPK